MSRGLKRAFSSAVLSAAMLCIGCDNARHQADRDVRSDLTEARQMQASDADAASIGAKLTQAAGNKDASPGVIAQAKAALALSELNLASEIMRKVDRTELQLSTHLWEITQLATQIRTSGSAVSGYKKHDPKPTRDAIAAKIAEAQGGPDKAAWFSQGNVTIPTLAAAKVQVAQLSGDLAQRNAELADLTQKRGKLLDDSEQAATLADQQKGQESLETYKKASDLRKQAGEVAVQIDLLKNQIDQIQRKLTIAQGQQTIVAEVISQLQDQSQLLDQSWKDYDTQSSSQMRLSALILGAASTGTDAASNPATAGVGGSISQKSVEVDRLVKELQQLRADAAVHGNNAASFYDEAYTQATAMVAEMDALIRDPANATRPEVASWKAIKDVINPEQYRLQRATVLRVLGEFYTGEVSSINDRLEVRTLLSSALAGTGLSMPTPLQGADLDAARKSALDNAEAAYKNSDDLLTNILDGNGSDQTRLYARLGHSLNYYGWSQVARLSGNASAATDYIAKATAERNAAAEMDKHIPTMPNALGPIPQPKVEAPPATEPAPATEQAATQPA